jgi:hypothetical protein
MMRELTMNEIDDVSGGVVAIVVLAVIDVAVIVYDAYLIKKALQ